MAQERKSGGREPGAGDRDTMSSGMEGGADRERARSGGGFYARAQSRRSRQSSARPGGFEAGWDALARGGGAGRGAWRESASGFGNAGGGYGGGSGTEMYEPADVARREGGAGAGRTQERGEREWARSAGQNRYLESERPLETGRGEMGPARRRRWQREPLTAGEIMTKDVKAVRPDDSIQDVARIMRDENTGVVPVVDESRCLAGLITDRDIVMRSLPDGKNPAEMRASELMTDDVEAVTEDESLRAVVDLMGGRQVRRVPVVDANDRLVGIISMADVANRADYDEDLQDALEEISARRSFWQRLFG